MQLTEKIKAKIVQSYPKAMLSQRTLCLGCEKPLFFGEMQAGYISIKCKNKLCRGINVFEGRKRSFIPAK